MSKVHQVAVSGFGEGTNDLYDRARPSYPPDALHKIYQTVSSSSPPPSSLSSTAKKGWKILEPGSGTGIFTRLLLSPPSAEYPNFPIATLISIEPSEGMRKNWTKNLLDKVPREALEDKVVEVVEGGFDDFSNVQPYHINNDPEDKGSKADAVIIAQAWHWCPDHEKALTEIASYLKPNAALILIWNLESYTPQWQAKVRDAYQKFDLGSPQYYKNWWMKMYDTHAYRELFEEKEVWKGVWSKGISEDGLIDRLFSKSYLTSAHLSSADRTGLENELRNIIRSAEHEWIDKENGIFKYSYDTDIVILRKKAL